MIPGFWGRDAEVAWLRALWTQTATRGPRMAFILAETGLGKSRLVQAFYQQLTREAEWDPPESAYWPDTFQDANNQLRVNPDLAGHESKGPPKFLWLGARWQRPDERNLEERRCVVPDLRAALDVHVAVARSHASLWRRLRAAAVHAVKHEGTGSAAEFAADHLELIPFGGLVLKAAVSLAPAFQRSSSARHEIHQRTERAAHHLIEEFSEVFGGWTGTGIALPTVLWLDDAQWIDDATLEFLAELWKTATARHWPLLVIVTHWEREWNELVERASGPGYALVPLYEDARTEAIILGPASPDDLGGYLGASLPGLTAAQRELMLDKAGGNFLTLVENVGELTDPDYFVDEKLDGALSSFGERVVFEWKSNRHERIRQRFKALAPEVKHVLGLASRIGTRFLYGALKIFEVRRKPPASTIDTNVLASCVHPYAILGFPEHRLLEFRDRAFYEVARKYFDDRLRDEEADLMACVREWLIILIDRSFDANGERVSRTTDPVHDVAPLNSAEPLELQTVLTSALRELPVPAEPDWNILDHISGFRAVLIWIGIAASEDNVDAIARASESLRRIEWSDIPDGVISADLLASAGDALDQGGVLDVAFQVRRHVVAMRERQLGENDWRTAAALTALAGEHVSQGQSLASIPLLDRATEILQHAPPGAEGEVLRALTRLHDAFMSIGVEYDAFERVFAAYRSGIARVETPPQDGEAVPSPDTGGEENASASSVASLVLRADACASEGRGDEAARMMEQAIALENSEWPDSAEAAGLSYQLATLYFQLGRVDDAGQHLKRALTIRERRLGPDHPLVADTLAALAEAAIAREEFVAGAEMLARAIRIREGRLGARHPSIALAAGRLALCYLRLGRYDDARPLIERAVEIGRASDPLISVAAMLEDLLVSGPLDGHLDDAEPVLNTVLSIYEKARGPSHEDTERALRNLGRLYRATSREELATIYESRADSVAEQRSVTAHPDGGAPGVMPTAMPPLGGH